MAVLSVLASEGPAGGDVSHQQQQKEEQQQQQQQHQEHEHQHLRQHQHQQQQQQQQEWQQQQQERGRAGAAPRVVIFSDELNHASIIDGARLAARGGGGGAVQLRVYRHSDLRHLEELLGSCPAGVRKIVVTDGLFSMDGDFADLRVRFCW
jgi:flagellar motor protein MotB